MNPVKFLIPDANNILKTAQFGVSLVYQDGKSRNRLLQRSLALPIQRGSRSEI